MEDCEQRNLICRTCMSENQHMTPISSIEIYGTIKATICDVLLECASLQVCIDDGLPEQVCTKCVGELNRAFLFRKLCEKTDTILRIRFSKIQNIFSTSEDDDVKTEPFSVHQQPQDVLNNLILKKEPQELNSETVDVETSSDEYGCDFEDVAETVKVEDVQINIGPEYNNYEESNVSLDELSNFENQHSSFLNDGNISNASNQDLQDDSYSITVEESEDTENASSTGDITSRTCSACNMLFRSRSLLLIHVKTHTADRPFKCTTCGKCFIQSTALKQHSLIHSGERPYKCDECDTSFTSASGLTRHKRGHTGEMPYSCEHCGKRFARPHGYTLHLRTHTGEKPEQCKICGKRFAQVGHLRSHILVHTRERPFRCDECGAGMSTKSALKRHVMRHRGVRPHKCTVCGHAFTDSNDLKVHLKMHDKVKKKRL